MLIQPQSVFKILKNVPISADGKNTILFPNLTQQLSYMNSKVFRTYNDFSYVRESKVVRVPISALEVVNLSDYYSCNYCMFQNKGFGNKWFFGYITNIEYVNNSVINLNIDVDYYQTWLFETSIGECYVEREHVTDDTIGLHTIPENLNVGEYICSGQDTNLATSGRGIACFYLPQEELNVNVGTVNNVVTPLSNIACGNNEAQTVLGDFFNNQGYKNFPEKIALVCGVPMGCVDTEQHILKGHVGEAIQYTRPTPFSMFYEGRERSYAPTNNKLYCYPYCFFTADNFNGQTETYKWEDFWTNGQANFSFQMTSTPKPCMEIFPISYKNLPTATNFGLTYTDFPISPFVSNSFENWVSREAPKAGVNATATLVNTALRTYDASIEKGSFDARETVSGITSLVQQGVNFYTEYEYNKIHAQYIQGNIGGSGLNWFHGRIGFRFTSFSVRPEVAKSIDDYFTRYGYRVNEYKVPNLTGRARFNYVKTRNCFVTGNIPNEAQRAISALFDNGITLWHTTTRIGDYSVDNSIVE